MSRAKTIYFVRHGQAEHNVSNNFSLPDPHLTELGLEQARSLADNDALNKALFSDDEGERNNHATPSGLIILLLRSQTSVHN